MHADRGQQQYLMALFCASVHWSTAQTRVLADNTCVLSDANSLTSANDLKKMLIQVSLLVKSTITATKSRKLPTKSETNRVEAASIITRLSN